MNWHKAATIAFATCGITSAKAALFLEYSTPISAFVPHEAPQYVTVPTADIDPSKLGMASVRLAGSVQGGLTISCYYADDADCGHFDGRATNGYYLTMSQAAVYTTFVKQDTHVVAGSGKANVTAYNAFIFENQPLTGLYNLGEYISIASVFQSAAFGQNIVSVSQPYAAYYYSTDGSSDLSLIFDVPLLSELSADDLANANDAGFTLVERPDAPGSDPSAVPELGTWAMLLFGFGAIGLTIRRRSAAKWLHRVVTAPAR